MVKLATRPRATSTALAKKKVKDGTKKAKAVSRPGPSSSDQISTFRAALTSPFSSAATGARVPDLYSVPTSTLHITRRFTLVTNSSGEADVIILPNAYWHAVSPRGSVVGGGGWSLLDGSTVTSAVVYTPTSNLQAKLNNYRIVGYGVRVMGVSSMTATQGVVLAAKAATHSYLNTKFDPVGGQTSTATNTNATRANTIIAYGYPKDTNNVVDLSALPTMPQSVETSLMAISERPMEINPKITSPEAFIFKQSADNAIGFNITDQTSLSNVQTGDASYLRVGGHESVCIAISGGPISQNAMEVEVIYHLEGVPNANSSQYVVADTPVALVNPMAFFSTVAKAALSPGFKQAAATGLNSVYPGLGTLAKSFF